MGQSPQNVPPGHRKLAYVLTAPFILHSSFCISPLRPPRNCGHSGSGGDCRLKAATQERRLQAADGLHNPANRLPPLGMRRPWRHVSEYLQRPFNPPPIDPAQEQLGNSTISWRAPIRAGLALCSRRSNKTPARSAGFPACGFTELSSSVVVSAGTNWGLESRKNSRTRMSALLRRSISAPFLDSACQISGKAHHFQLWRSLTNEERTTLCENNLASCPPAPSP